MTPTDPFLYQEFGQYFAQIAHPTEELGGEELVELGATDIQPGYRGVHFNADKETLYRIVYCARICTRVLAPIVTFDCHSDRYLYTRAQEIDWSQLMGLDDTFAVFANVSNSRISHSKFAALRVKDAIVDQFRDRTGSRPNIDRRDPDLWINLHIEGDRATISLDASGGSMHRRGYRQDANEAPLQETVAASIIRMSGWTGERPLIDPMCGSGTLLAEAWMALRRIPAGFMRAPFGFERFPDFDQALWKRVKAAADGAMRDADPALVTGSDVDSRAVQTAMKNLDRLPGGKNISVVRADFRSIGPISGATIVTNPPYGLRLGTDDAAKELIRAFGDFLKQECTGSTAFIYVGNPELLKSVGLRTKWKKPLVNGNLEGRLARYDLY